MKTRREFLRSSARNVVGGAFAVVGIVLGRRSIASGETCTSRGVCGACSKIDSCGLPRALAVRRAIGEEGALHG